MSRLERQRQGDLGLTGQSILTCLSPLNAWIQKQNRCMAPEEWHPELSSSFHGSVHTHTQRSFPYISCDSKNSHIQERLVLPYMDEDMGQKGFSSFTKVTGITGNSGCDWHPGPSASKAVPVPSFATWEPGYSLKSCPKVHVGKIFPVRPLSFYQMFFALQCHSPGPVLHCQMISWQV